MRTLGDSTRTIFSAFCLTVVSAGLLGALWLALDAEARTGQEAQLHDGGAWLIKRDAGAIGHLNRQVQQVSAAVTIDGPELTVHQSGRLIAIDHGNSRMSLFDGRTHRIVSELSIPSDAQVHATPSAVVIHSAAERSLWRLSPTDITAHTELMAITPQYESPRHEGAWLIAVSPRHIAIIDGSELITLDNTNEPTARPLEMDHDFEQLTLTGEQILGVREGSVWDVRSGHQLEFDGMVRQVHHPHDEGPILVITEDHHLHVHGHDTNAVLPAGEHHQPIWLDGCAFTLTQSTHHVFARHCPSGSSSIEIPAVGPLRMTVVNGWVWVSDLDSGATWSADAESALARVDDWGAALAKDPDEDAEATTEDSGGVAEVRINPDADDAELSKPDPQDDDGDNEPPVARDDHGTTRVDRPIIVRVLDNDTDPDGDVLMISHVEPLMSNAAQIDAIAGGTQLQITPAAGMIGTITAAYTVDDGRGGQDRAVVTIEVIAMGATNRAPQPRTDVIVAQAGRQASVNVLSNDSDPDGDGLLLTAVMGGDDHGVIAFDPDGTVSFTPDPAAADATIELHYTVSDELGATATGRLLVFIRIAGSNAAPDARNDVATAAIGHPVTINVLANDSDPDGDVLTLARPPLLISGPAGVTVEAMAARTRSTADGTVTIDPPQPGTYRFDYLVSDGQSQDRAQLRLEITDDQANRAPTATADTIVIPRGGTRVLRALDNDFDPDGDVIGIVEFSAGDGLDVQPYSDLGFIVSVDADAPARSTFRYGISDGHSDAVITTVDVIVAELPSHGHPPIPGDDRIEIRPGATITAPVLVNDVDPAGTPLRITGVTTASDRITTRVNQQGTALSITASPGPAHTAIGSYEVTNGNGDAASAMLSIRVLDPTEANRPPLAVSDVIRTTESSPVDIDVLSNDSDPDSDAIALSTITSQPSHGQVALTDRGLRYSPDPGFVGTDRFSYSIIDAQGATARAEVRVGVMPRPQRNRPPIAGDDYVELTAGSGWQRIDVLANDYDPDGDDLQILSLNAPADVASRIHEAGIEINVGTENRTVEYTITDGAGHTDTAVVHIVIRPEPTPLPPIAADDTIGPVRAGQTITVDVLVNDVDPDGSVLTLKALDPAATVVEGKLRVTVGSTSHQVRYEITNAHGLSDQATLSVLVVENRPPAVALLSVSTDPVTTITVDVGPQVSDPDGDPLIFTCCEAVQGGTAQVLSSGTGTMQVQFTPSPGAHGLASFSYRVDDQHGHVVAGRVHIHVTGAENQPPVLRDTVIELEAGQRLPIQLPSLAHSSQPLRFDVHSSVHELSGSTLWVTAPADGAGQQFTISIRATDPAGLSAEGTVTMRVTPSRAAPPRAVNDVASTVQGSPVSISVLDNDIDPLGNGLEIVSVGASPAGTVRAEHDDVIFEPDPAFFGSTSILYTITDATRSPDRMSSGQINISVIGRPSALATPTAAAEPHAIVATWTAPAANGSSIDTYRVMVESDSGPIDSIDIGPSTHHRLDGLRNGQRYRVAVQAHNSAGWGDVSGWSDWVIPDIVPERPSPPRASFADRALVVNWDPAVSHGTPITGYQLEIGGGRNAVTGVGAAPYTWSGLDNGTEYQFRLRAENAAGFSEWSHWSSSEHPLAPPAQPSAPTVIRGNRFLDVSWHAPANNGDAISHYELQQERDGTIVRVTAESYRWANLVNGQSQRFRVRAGNRAPDPGAWSAWSAAVTPCAVPQAPHVPSAIRGDRQVALSWNAPSDEGCAISGYAVIVSGNDGSVLNRTTGAGTSITVDQLINGVGYQFSVAAINEEGTGPPSSTSAVVVPAGRPTMASISSAQPPAAGQLSVVYLAGQPNGSAITRNEVSINGGHAQPIGPSPHRLDGLAPSTRYDLRVRSCNDIGCGDWSSTVSATTWGPPGTPNGVHAVAGNTNATVSWNAPGSDGGTPITGYHITTPLGFSEHVPAPQRSLFVGGLGNGIAYTFEVAACNALGCSPAASTTVTPQAPPVTVSLTRGGPYTGVNCLSGDCQYVHIEGRNLSPNTAVQLSCYDNVHQRFKTVTATTNSEGSISADPCHMGYPGRLVWASITDPIRGKTLSNSMTW